jgi:hypothetical protein
MSYLNKLTDAVILTLVGSVTGFVLVSMLMALNYHANGSLEWDKLGEIGEFWGGHLNSVALIFLGMTLLVQRQQFNQQQLSDESTLLTLQKEVEALTTEHQRQELRFGMEQLRAESGRLTFRRMVRNENTQWNAGPNESGLSALEAAWHLENDTEGDTFVLLSQLELQSYIQIAERARSAMEALGGPSLEMYKPLLQALSPKWLAELNDERKRKRQETQVFFATNCPGSKEWVGLIEEGWRFESSLIIAGKQIVILYRDNFHAPKRLSFRGAAPDSLAKVLSDNLPKVENESRTSPKMIEAA